MEKSKLWGLRLVPKGVFFKFAEINILIKAHHTAASAGSVQLCCREVGLWGWQGESVLWAGAGWLLMVAQDGEVPGWAGRSLLPGSLAHKLCHCLLTPSSDASPMGSRGWDCEPPKPS